MDKYSISIKASPLPPLQQGGFTEPQPQPSLGTSAFPGKTGSQPCALSAAQLLSQLALNGNKLQKSLLLMQPHPVGWGHRTSAEVSKGDPGLLCTRLTHTGLLWLTGGFHTAQLQQISHCCQLMTSFPKHCWRISYGVWFQGQIPSTGRVPLLPPWIAADTLVELITAAGNFQTHFAISLHTHQSLLLFNNSWAKSFTNKFCWNAVQAHLFCHNTWKP